ncbi:hypothetical protein Dimus_029061, partial [Dionaea muscipula]
RQGRRHLEGRVVRSISYHLHQLAWRPVDHQIHRRRRPEAAEKGESRRREEGQSTFIITWPRANSATRSTNRPPGEEEDFQPRCRSAQAQSSHLHRHRARSSRAGAQLLTTAGQAFISTTPPTTPQPRTEPPHVPSPPPRTTRPRRSPPSPSAQVCIIDHRSRQPHRADNHHWSTTSSAIAEPASIQPHLDRVPS